MDDRDLELVRAFRAAEAQPPPGLRARIEEDLWRVILAEEAARANPRRGSGSFARWRGSMVRPLVAAGAAVTLAVGVAMASDGGAGTVGPAGGTVREAGAGVLDGAATALFGQDSEPIGTRGSAPVGSIDLTDPDDDDHALARGPLLTVDRELDESSIDAVRGAPRDPAALRATMRAAAAGNGSADPTDRAAFHMAMRWVVQPAVPTELRASMLRSIEGMAGLDAAAMGVDVLGRRGLVVGHFDPITGLREQWVLDPERAVLLEQRAYTTAYVDPACPPGTVTQHVAFDDEGNEIDTAEAPYIDWPQVIAACDSRPLTDG